MQLLKYLFWFIGVILQLYSHHWLCHQIETTEPESYKPATLLKEDSNAGVFLWNFFEFFGNTFFYRTPPLSVFVALHSLLTKVKSQFVNLCHTTGLFLHPPKTSENQRFSDVSRRYRKKPMSWNGFIMLKLILKPLLSTGFEEKQQQ